MELRDLLHAPMMVLSLIGQLLFFTFTEPEMFLLAATAVVFGVLLTPLWGVAIYLSVYLAWRMTGGYVQLFASKLHLIASVMDRRQEK